MTPSFPKFSAADPLKVWLDGVHFFLSIVWFAHCLMVPFTVAMLPSMTIFYLCFPSTFSGLGQSSHLMSYGLLLVKVSGLMGNRYKRKGGYIFTA